MAGLKITFHTDAIAEFREAYLWYNAQLPGLGSRFAGAVSSRLLALLENPRQGKIIRREFREIIVDSTFPYQIVFQHRKDLGEVFISAVHHTSRHPARKYRRPE